MYLRRFLSCVVIVIRVDDVDPDPSLQFGELRRLEVGGMDGLRGIEYLISFINILRYPQSIYCAVHVSYNTTCTALPRVLSLEIKQVMPIFLCSITTDFTIIVVVIGM